MAMHPGVTATAALLACAAVAPSAARAQSANWTNMPKMLIERQFAGPLADTVIQRLRDPVDGTVCYLYLPISAPHAPAAAGTGGFLQYGSNTIGSISCTPAPRAPAAAAPRRTGP